MGMTRFLLCAALPMLLLSPSLQAQPAEPAPRPQVRVTPLDGGTPIPEPKRPPSRYQSDPVRGATAGLPRSIVTDPAREQAGSLLRGPAPVAAPLAQADVPDRIIIDRDHCARYRAQAVNRGGDANYRPGVDVHGRPVAPADLPGSNSAAPPVATDLLLNNRRNMPPGSGLRGESYAGTVTVDGQGRALLNGQPLDGAGGSEILELCRRAGF